MRPWQMDARAKTIIHFRHHIHLERIGVGGGEKGYQFGGRKGTTCAVTLWLILLVLRPVATGTCFAVSQLRQLLGVASSNGPQTAQVRWSLAATESVVRSDPDPPHSDFSLKPVRVICRPPVFLEAGSRMGQ